MRTEIKLSGATSLDSSHPDNNYSNEDLLYARQMEGAYGHGTCIALIQFQIPEELIYKVIDSVTLSYSLKRYSGQDNIMRKNFGYMSSDALCYGQITYNDYASCKYGATTNSSTMYWKNIRDFSEIIPTTDDITEIYTNAVINGIFTLVVSNMIGLFGIVRNSISIVIEYKDIEPVAPTILFPLSTYINRNNEITFKWRHNTQSKAGQKSVLIEAFNLASESEKKLTIDTENEYYTFPAKYFNIGAHSIRIATVDVTGLKSPYAESMCTIIGPPGVPIINSYKNCCLTEITWNSTREQSGYELVLYNKQGKVFEVGMTTNDNYCKPNVFLDNDEYQVKVRIVNVYGYWSEYAIFTVEINTEAPDRAEMAVYSQTDHVVVKLLKNMPVNSVLYRQEQGKDAEPVHKFLSDNYTDYNIKCGCLYKYFVRTYDNGYTDSRKETVVTNFNGFSLSDVGSNNNINFTLSDENYMPLAKTRKREKKLCNYIGRKYPIVEVTEFVSNVITRTFKTTASELDMLYAMDSGKVLVYRDQFGNLFGCVITEISAVNDENNDDYFKVTIKVEQVERDDEVILND